MKYKNTSHVLHAILSIIFFPWLIVWLWCASSNSKTNKWIDREAQKEQNESLKRIVHLLEVSIQLEKLKDE
jgi:Cu/Ag efflux pump CusA